MINYLSYVANNINIIPSGKVGLITLIKTTVIPITNPNPFTVLVPDPIITVATTANHLLLNANTKVCRTSHLYQIQLYLMDIAHIPNNVLK